MFDKNKGVICIQVLGEPQEITATSMAGANTHYNVLLEEELVFSGILDKSSESKMDIDLYMKIKKNLVLLSIWNNDQVPVYAIEIEAGDVVDSVKTRVWTSEVDDKTVLLHTKDKPLTQGRNLITLQKMDDMHSGISWKALDINNDVIRAGAMIP